MRPRHATCVTDVRCRAPRAAGSPAWWGKYDEGSLRDAIAPFNRTSTKLCRGAGCVSGRKGYAEGKTRTRYANAMRAADVYEYVSVTVAVAFAVPGAREGAVGERI